MTSFDLLAYVDSDSSAYHSGQLVGRILQVAVLLLIAWAVIRWAKKRRRSG
jgi:hypothetical protein